MELTTGLTMTTPISYVGPYNRKQATGWCALLLLSAIAFPILACARVGGGFDGNAAYALLERQCTFGPRYPGSPGHQACLEFLVQELSKYAAEVRQQHFDHTFGLQRKTTARATNIIARFWPQERRRILLCAHWDTRPWADEDPDPKNRRKPILGANDGASGVAVLLEIAHQVDERNMRIGLDIVLFDAEDQGTPGDDDSYAVGSRYYARHLPEHQRPEFAILLDMVGDRDLNLYQEGYSLQYARPYVELVWGIAAELDVREFIPRPGYYVTDDHVRLIEVGIPAIDIIDFDYPFWHTLEDTPDKCSPESLEKVGKVLMRVLEQW